MKNKFIKLISSILVLAFLVSAFAVLVAAETPGADTGTEEEAPLKPEDITLLINRTYSEGWVATNGFTQNVNNNIFEIDYEETRDFGYNYFMRVEAGNKEEGYIDAIYGDNTPDGPTVVEFDLKIDDDTDFSDGAIFSARYGTKYSIPLVNIKDNFLYLPEANAIGYTVNTAKINDYNKPSVKVTELNGEWVHIAFAIQTNMKQCPVCSTISPVPPKTPNSTVICCADAGGVPLSQMANVIQINIYFGYAESFDPETVIDATTVSDGNFDLANNTYCYSTSVDTISYFDTFRIGLPGVKNIVGNSYLVDNFRLYNGADVPVAPDFVEGYGENVDESQAKTIEIKGNDSEKTALQFINEGLVMKVGSGYCLNANQLTVLEDGTEDGVYSGPAVKIDGDVYVPLQAILDWIGYPMYAHADNMSFDISTANGSTFVTIGRDTATANGELIPLSAAPVLVKEENYGRDYICVALADVEKLFAGYYVTYDEMGLIVIANGPKLLDRSSDLALMLDIMREFIYDDNTATDYYNKVKENTNNFDHPYLVANEDDFTALKNAYKAENGNETFKKYVNSVLADADDVYASYACEDPANNNDKLLYVVTVDELGNTNIATEIYNPLESEENAGYDKVAGRLDEIAEYCNELLLLAFAYRMTGDAKYARLAYEFAVSLSKWEHWGPAYFINCADATAAYAIAYDWLYDVWTGEDAQVDPWTEAAIKYDVNVIEDAIYKHGVYQGYRSANGLECLYPRNQADEDSFTTASNYWNAVGTSGMVIGSLALLGTKDDYVENSLWMLENTTKNLIRYGLDAYAPDGSYAASPYYWSYSTNAIALMSWCIESATGDDQGFMDTWGMDQTFYYALQTEFPSVTTPDGYQMWNYNDAPLASQNTSFFFYAADALNDSALAALRAKQLERKTVTIWDVLGYDASYAELDASDVELSLDNRFTNVEGTVSRSDWSDGALFVGVMGNRNDMEFGHVDSGNFIYANKNYTWFCDLGGENDRVYGYTDADYRYGYYKVSAEGSNVVAVTNESLIPYGQVVESGGIITDYKTTEAGSYTIINNTAVYGDVVNKANRGVLLTNNRKTVVIQDEIDFSDMRTAVWMSQTAAQIEILDDQKTALLYQTIDGQRCVLRATLLSNNEAFKFSVKNSTELILSGTYGSKFSSGLGGAAEDARNEYSRLVIETGRTMTFNVAIVIEMLDGYSEDDLKAPVEYEYVDLNKWSTSDVITEEFSATVKNENVIGNTTYATLTENIKVAGTYIRNGYAFTSRTADFYRAMAYCAQVVQTYKSIGAFDPDAGTFAGKQVYQAYLDYLDYKVQYDYFIGAINTYAAENNSIARYLSASLI